MVTKDNYWLSGYMDGYSMFYFTIITNNSVKGLNIRGPTLCYKIKDFQGRCN